MFPKSPESSPINKVAMEKSQRLASHPFRLISKIQMLDLKWRAILIIIFKKYNNRNPVKCRKIYCIIWYLNNFFGADAISYSLRIFFNSICLFFEQTF